ncbi:MAG TPA: isoprenylcysteine carboxylmethyltransferase family protein [Candidatus Binatia bacterium]|nr:isoprenylcysteine carboxylmethyltransferase family protein [Candidatus Binatia bacterium]
MDESNRWKGWCLAPLLLLAIQRLLEVHASEQHVDALLRRGGREHALYQYRAMTVLHAGWFVAIVAEAIGMHRRFRPRLAMLATPLFILGQCLRYAAIRTLGERWTARVITLPGAAPVTRGIYRYLRHPNYLGVVLEIATVPLLYSAYWTALFFSLANALLLRARVRAEEHALAMDNDYAFYTRRGRWFWVNGLRQAALTSANDDAQR